MMWLIGFLGALFFAGLFLVVLARIDTALRWEYFKVWVSQPPRVLRARNFYFNALGERLPVPKRYTR